MGKRFSIYLVGYNATSALAWLLLTAFVLLSSRDEDPYRISRAIAAVQSIAIAEIAHSMFGIVNAPVGTTAMQVASRLFISYGALLAAPSSASGALPHLSVVSLILAWGPTEVIRYSLYAIQSGLNESPPPFLVWLRYSAFLVLYPLGVLSEVSVSLAALPLLRESGALSVRMPNAFNIAVDFPTVSMAVLGAYPPGFYILFTHMLRQRRRVLGRIGGMTGGDAKAA